MPSKLIFFNSLIRIWRQANVSSPVESGRIEAHENVHFSHGNNERRSSKLADENAKCWVPMLSCIWKELQLLRLAVDCSKITRTSVKVEKTIDSFQWFYFEHRSKLSADYSSGERWYGIVEVDFTNLRRPAIATSQPSVYLLDCISVSVVWAFSQKLKNLLIINRDSSIVVVVLYCIALLSTS